MASAKLSRLKGRTGLTPNILARIGFALSLKDQTIPEPKKFDSNGKDIGRHTLTGDYDTIIMCLLRNRCIKDGIEAEADVAEQFRAHMNSGVFLLDDKIKNITDFKELVS